MTERKESLLPTRRPPPFERLFIATDFSTGASQAISRAARLPLADRGELTVLHVLPERIPQRVRADAEKLARRQLDQATKILRKTATTLGRPKINISSELCRGQPYVEIIRRARSVAADLIVLGRHGRRPVRDMFIGSTAERVIRAGALPVLVVSRRAGGGYRRPVVAVDLEDTCRAVISLALRTLEPKVVHATMLHAYNVPFEGFLKPGMSRGAMTELRAACRQTATSGVAKLQAALGDLGVQWQMVLVRGDARTAILAGAVRRRADLLAVGTHGRSGIAHALVGSVAEWVIRAAPCDVLVARPARVSFELP